MAKKQEKEIERWVTVNGARVPIFKDGSIGGPKAIADKIKKSGKKESKKKDDGSKERLSVYERQLAEVNDELANQPKSKALRNEEGIRELEKKKAQLESYIAKEKKSSNSTHKEENTYENRQKLKKQIDDYRDAHRPPTDEDRRIVKQMRDKYDAMVKESMDKSKAKAKAAMEAKSKKEAQEKELADLKQEHFKLYKHDEDDIPGRNAKLSALEDQIKEKEKQIARNKKEADVRNNKESKTWTEKDKERYKAVRAYSRGEISPEEMKKYGFSDKQLKDISEMGRREALQGVVEGKNVRTYIDPLGNLNRKKIKSKYEENHGEDYRNMSVAEAKERLADDGKTNHRVINGKDVKNLDDQAILQLSVNRWKYNLTKLQDKALDEEIKSRGYVYQNGSWKKKK